MFNELIKYLNSLNLNKEANVANYLLHRYATSENNEETQVISKNPSLKEDDPVLYHEEISLPRNIKDSKLYPYVYKYIKDIATQIGRESKPINYRFNKKDAFAVVNKAKQFDDNLNFYGPWQDNLNLLKPLTFKNFVKKVSSDVLVETGYYHNYELYNELLNLLTDLYNDFYTIEVLESEFDLSEAKRRTNAGRWQ
jgi:hypothetical protein